MNTDISGIIPVVRNTCGDYITSPTSWERHATRLDLVVTVRSAGGEDVATKSTFVTPHPHPALRADLSRARER
jgi:hypothetical protein